jgi:hypothetical protein
MVCELGINIVHLGIPGGLSPKIDSDSDKNRLLLVEPVITFPYSCLVILPSKTFSILCEEKMKEFWIVSKKMRNGVVTVTSFGFTK